MKSRACLLFLIVLPAISGCRAERSLALAAITAVGPAAVEPGDVLRIEGQGFVEGPVIVAFEGALAPSGVAAPKPCAAEAPGQASSETLVEVPVTELLVASLGREPGRFQGRVEVTFTSAASTAIRIAAEKRDVSFDLRPAGAGVPLAAHRLHETSRVLAALGITLMPPETDEGLVVADVEQRSAAARSGMAAGDRLLSVDGTSLATASDLAGLSCEVAHRFEIVSREGTLRELRLEAVESGPVNADELTAIVLSSLALGLFLAFAAPTSRRLGRASDAWAGNPLARAASVASVSTLLLLLPAVAILGRVGLAGVVALTALAGAGLVALALQAPAGLGRRAAGLLVHALPVLGLLAIMGSLGVPLGLVDLVADQQRQLAGWHVWSSPFALAAVLGAVALLAPVTLVNAAPGRFDGLLAELACAPAAALIAVGFLGGWSVPGADDDAIGRSGALLIAASFVFLAKVWGVLLVARRLALRSAGERRASSRGANIWLRAFALALAVAAALAWNAIDVPDTYRIAARVLTIAVFVTLSTALVIAAVRGLLPRSIGAAGGSACPVPRQGHAAEGT